MKQILWALILTMAILAPVLSQGRKVSHSKTVSKQAIGNGGAQTTADDFVLAANQGDVAKLKTMIANGVDINAKNSKGETALEGAVLLVRYEAVEFLIESGAKLDRYELHNAVSLGSLYLRIAMVIALKSSGLTTALAAQSESAIYDDHANIVKFLLKKGLNPNLAAKWDGKTPLIRIVEYGNQQGGFSHAPRIVKILLDAGANPRLRDRQGRTPLGISKNPEIILLLKKAIGKK